MTSKGYAVIQEFIKNSNIKIEFVVSERDSKIKKDFYSEIKSVCSLNSIGFFDRDNSPLIPEECLIIAVSWKWIINFKGSKLIVFHDSLLPRLRGFNPLVTSLINGEESIGVSAIFGSEEFDRGDIIFQHCTQISYPITILEAINIVEKSYVKLSKDLAKILSKNQLPKASPQEEEFATYSLWREESDYFIDWKLSSKAIRRFIDAVGFPYKGAAASLSNGNIVRILMAQELEDVVIENRVPGKVIFLKESKPVIVCGSGLLLIQKLEDEYGNNLLPLSKFRTKFLSN